VVRWINPGKAPRFDGNRKSASVKEKMGEMEDKVKRMCCGMTVGRPERTA
jgi:hypothetical protein